MTTIYKESQGSPEPYLQAIAAAGFTHIHWSHHWSTDFLYSMPEVAQIKRWLKDYALQVLDMHASAGREKRWDSSREYRRLAGVELVRNRLELAASLGAGAIVLHAYPDQSYEFQRRSLAELEPYARLLGVRIALENLFEGNLERLAQLFNEFSPDFLAFCYDTGHGNMLQGSMDFLERWNDRLAAVHIHDNDGTADQHRLPFTASVDWARFARLVAESAYHLPLNLECTLGNHNSMPAEEFLSSAYQAGSRLEEMRRKDR
jgi:sugar phosphate isomerase/epimerase